MVLIIITLFSIISQLKTKQRHVILTSIQQLQSGIGQIDGYEIFEPCNGGVGVAGRAAQHHCVAVLLYRLQGRALRDSGISAWNYKEK